MRIVSLLASATEIVGYLRLDADLVGISADSDWPPELVRGRPILNTIAFDPDRLTSREIDEAASQGHSGSSLYHIDAALLRDLHPDLILTQEVCDVCSVARRDLEAVSGMLGYAPEVVSLNAVDLEGVLSDIACVGRVAGVEAQATQRVADLRGRLKQVQARSSGLKQARVLCMEWLDPPYCAGHWLPEMVELAGGCDTLGIRSGPSRQIDWSEIVDYAPEVIVLMPCSLSLQRVATEFDVVRAFEGWPTLPAVQSGQVYAAHTDLFSRSGPRLVDGTEMLARVLHPDIFTTELAEGLALHVSRDGQRLEPFR